MKFDMHSDKAQDEFTFNVGQVTKDIIGLNSSNPVVVQAELITFKAEFAGAVAQASRLLG